ncbi:2519_t:CDS:10 [Ambispora gerdemannii]|uniref:DNA polymerase alpha subunit B n=1 Tax=Ambispora gerdemannii TaxID=144530 RepID=A0A9N8V8W0_9GLOM|nr:2519_t:CDS:10 [Ambispora gerdemannii]
MNVSSSSRNGLALKKKLINPAPSRKEHQPPPQQQQLKPEEPQKPTPQISNEEINVQLLENQNCSPYRYMHEKLTDRMQGALDEQIEYFIKLFKKCYSDKEIFDPSRPNQEPITTVGRVCCDSEGKLNTGSIVLETSQSLGRRRRVRLSLREVQSFSLFPGQIIAVDGINITGNVLDVSKIYKLPLLPMPVTSTAEIMSYNYGKARLNGEEMTVIVAAGPFTTESNLNFEPFAQLMENMKSIRPDVLILMGPFIETDHTLIKSGEIDYTLENIFSRFISYPIRHFIKSSPASQIIMIPSVKDITHYDTVFPQPPFEQASINSLGLPQGVIFYPNPAQFRVNEIVFGVGANEIISHLSGAECQRNITTERMIQLCRHVLEQQSFYPIFPPYGGVNLSLTHSDRLKLEILPDVLILPSRHLQYFVKVVEGVLCINPASLAKNTFVKMTVKPINRDGAKNEQVQHQIKERTKVEIIKI